MLPPEHNPSAASERGASIALIFALLAERLRFHYEHDKWLNQAQCAALAADWLARSKRNMRLETRKHLADMSEQLAKQISESTSREAGLYRSWNKIRPNPGTSSLKPAWVIVFKISFDLKLLREHT